MAYAPVSHDISISQFDLERPMTSVDRPTTPDCEDNAEQKPFQHISIHEFDQSTPPRSLSDTLTIKTEAPVSSGVSRENSNRSSSRFSSTFSKTGSWTFELISLFIAAASVAAIVGILGRFDGRAIPSWPLDITLSALIALLATLANANLAVPLQSGLSQLKWIRFKAGRAPLTDMEIFDDASRGTWGAIKLLIKARGGFYGSFGAVLTILALALGPFAQQIASYRSHMVQSIQGAAIPRALNYTGYLPGRSSSNGFVPLLPMKSAVYAGLFAENNDPTAGLNVTCSTGNCTFQPYETLAVCNTCLDMSKYMTRYCEGGTPSDGNVSACGWQLPDGSAYLNQSSDAFSMTSAFPSASGNMAYSTIMQLTFMGTESRDAPNILDPWAQQCTLSACVRTLSSAVNNGYLSENTTNLFINTSVIDISSAKGDVPVVLTSPETNATYTLAMGAKLALESWFADVFKTGSASRSAQTVNQTVSDGNVIVNLTVGVSSGETFFDTDIVTAFYWNYYEYPDGLNLLMEDLATTMTVSMRSFVGAVPQPGLAWSWESFVHVRWAFITVPIMVVVLTGVFLAAAMWRTRLSGTKLWKSSALAMLLHGLDGETRDQLGGGGGTLDEKRRRARDVKVQLDGTGDAGSLLRV